MIYHIKKLLKNLCKETYSKTHKTQWNSKKCSSILQEDRKKKTENKNKQGMSKEQKK